MLGKNTYTLMQYLTIVLPRVQIIPDWSVLKSTAGIVSHMKKYQHSNMCQQQDVYNIEDDRSVTEYQPAKAPGR